MVRNKRKTKRPIAINDIKEVVLTEKSQEIDADTEKKKWREEMEKFDNFVKRIFDQLRNIGISASVLFAGIYLLHNPSSINKIIGGEVEGVPPSYYFMSMGTAWIVIAGGVCLLILCYHHAFLSIVSSDSITEKTMSRKEGFLRLLVLWFLYLPLLLAIVSVALR